MDKTCFRHILLHEFKLHGNATLAAQNINKAWGDNTANVRTVQFWFQKFRNGDFSLQDREGRGRPSEVDNDELKALVEQDPRQTIRQLANRLNVGIATIHLHIQQIGKVKKMDKWVPHELNENQKNRRLEVCFSLIARNKIEPFLHRIITCDEKWILYDNRRRSGQWLDHDEAPQHFPKPNLHPKKVMVTVWWSSAGIIHYNFLNQGDAITADKYCSEIQIMHDKLRQKQPSLVNRKGPILLHDNARPHVAQQTLQKLNELQYEILPHPPYSPDISPTDFHLFKHLDHFMTNKTFKDKAAVENAFKEFIDSKNVSFYCNGINNLLLRWQKCVDSNGAYFD